MKLKKIFIFLTSLLLVLSSCSKKQEENELPTYVKEKYNVYWKVEDKVILQEEIKEGKTPKYNGTTPSKPNEGEYHFNFTGWDPVPSPVERDITYNAVFEKSINEYTITYDTNGGSSINPIKKPYGTKIIRSEQPTKEGSRFTCWTLDKENKVPVTYPYTITKNVTFYACYDVTIKSDKEQQLEQMLNTSFKSPDVFIPDMMKRCDIDNHNQLNYNFKTNNDITKINKNGELPEWSEIISFNDNIDEYIKPLSAVSTTQQILLNEYNNHINNTALDSNKYSTKIGIYNISINIDEQYINYRLYYNDLSGIQKNVDIQLNRITSEIITKIELANTYTFKYNQIGNEYIFSVYYPKKQTSYLKLQQLNNSDIKGEFNNYTKDLNEAILFSFKQDGGYVIGNSTGKVAYEYYPITTIGSYYRIEDELVDKIYFDLAHFNSFKTIKIDETDSNSFYINDIKITPSIIPPIYGFTLINKTYTQVSKNILTQQVTLNKQKHKIPMFYCSTNDFATVKESFESAHNGLTLDLALDSNIINEGITNFETNKTNFNGFKGKITKDYIINFVTI